MNYLLKLSYDGTNYCCYRGGDGRTRLKVLRCEKQDYIDLAVCIACFAVILASRLVFPNF